ncbi:hypothetical protein BU15DRAFT_77394 [Melanogaster broomeanus]|nr:hypothetical protein BU15DRAFT_77394 [Melanogaster broomeanus]
MPASHSNSSSSSNISCFPYAHINRFCPSGEQMDHYRLFTQDSQNNVNIETHLDEYSPLRSTYLALLQLYRLKPLSRYVRNSLEPSLEDITLIRDSIFHTQERELLNLLHQLDFDRIQFDISGTLPRPSSPWTSTARPDVFVNKPAEVPSSFRSPTRELPLYVVPAPNFPSSSESSPSSESSISPIHALSPPPTRVPPPQNNHRQQRVTILTTPLSHANRRNQHSPPPSSSSASQSSGTRSDPIDVDAMEAFGISYEELAASMTIAEGNEEIRQLCETIPLTPSHPHYRETCYHCHHLGHIRIRCLYYECPLCKRFCPGHTQTNCPRPMFPRPDETTLVGDDDFSSV